MCTALVFILKIKKAVKFEVISLVLLKSLLVGCYAVSTGNYLLTFQKYKGTILGLLDPADEGTS